MPKSDDHPTEALKRLDAELRAFETKRAVTTSPARDGGASQAYRMMAGLIGGVFGGLGLGWLFDRLAHTAPFGLIVGLLIGVVVSTYAAVRAAGRMSSKSEAIPAPIAPAEDGVE
jgi:ATP synthase protein I